MTYRLFCLLVILCTIVSSFLIWGGYGILGSCLVVFFTVPVWSSVYMNKSRLGRRELKADLVSFISEGFWRIIIFIPFHLWIAFTIGRLTMLPDVSLVYFIVSFLGYAYAFFIKKKKNIYWYSLAVFPSTISLFLLLNYFISFNASEETYPYKRYTSMQISKLENETFIIGYRIRLEGNTYLDYPGIRSFLSENSFKGNMITYTFKTGIFGIRVVSKRVCKSHRIKQ